MFILPLRSKNPPESLPVGTLLLIILNIAVFLATQEGGDLKLSVANDYGLYGGHVSFLTLITYSFLHGYPFHLIFNLWFLYIFGFAVEGRLRTPKFLILYMASAIAGGLLHMGMSQAGGTDVPLVGASGAIMGVVGAALYMFPYAQVNVLFCAFLIYWRVIIFQMYWLAIIYFVGDILGAFAQEGPVAHLAHLGGAAGGILVCFIFRAPRDSSQASEAKAMYSDMKDMRYLSSRELAAMAQHNPNNTTLVLNWMSRSLRDGKVSPECQQSFLRLLPQILQHEPVQATGWALSSLMMTPGIIKPALALDIGKRLENAGDCVTALRLYEAILRDPAADEVDREASLFRLAFVCETALNNNPRAATAYQEIITKYPMSPFAGQALMRLQAMQRATG